MARDRKCRFMRRSWRRRSASVIARTGRSGPSRSCGCLAASEREVRAHPHRESLLRERSRASRPSLAVLPPGAARRLRDPASVSRGEGIRAGTRPTPGRTEADAAPTLRDAEARAVPRRFTPPSPRAGGGTWRSASRWPPSRRVGRWTRRWATSAVLALHLGDDERAGAIPAPPPRLIVSYETSAYSGVVHARAGHAPGSGQRVRVRPEPGVRLPKRVAFPDGVDKVDVTVLGNARLLAPAGETWATWFEGAGVSEDFMMTRDQPLDQERSSL